MFTLSRPWPAVLLALLAAGACTNSPSREPASLGTASAGGTAGTSGGTAGASAARGPRGGGGRGGSDGPAAVGGTPRIDVDASPGDDAGAADVCATVSASAELEP